MVMYSLCIWIRNIDYFFYPPTEHISWEPIYIIVMALQLPDAYLRIITQQCEPRKNLSLWKVLKTILPNAYTLLFLTVIVLGKDSSNSLIWFCQEVIGCFLLFRRAKNIYQSFRLTSTALNYEYHLKAIDLLITLFLISHLIVTHPSLRPSASISSLSLKQAKPGFQPSTCTPTLASLAISTRSISPPRLSSLWGTATSVLKTRLKFLFSSWFKVAVSPSLSRDHHNRLFDERDRPYAFVDA